jgi:hypothetical protein
MKDFMEQHGERCEHCNEYVLEDGAIRVMGKIWHMDCLKCSNCDKQMERGHKMFKGPPSAEDRITLYCSDCAQSELAPKCAGCTCIK